MYTKLYVGNEIDHTNKTIDRIVLCFDRHVVEGIIKQNVVLNNGLEKELSHLSVFIETKVQKDPPLDSKWF